MPEQASAARWDAPVAALTDEALGLAASCDDATKAARLLAEVADRGLLSESDRFSTLMAVRWRLAGMIDANPGDLVAVVAMGVCSLASIEPPVEDRSWRDR